jgi:chitinase
MKAYPTLALLLAFLFTSTHLYSQEARVIGYLPSYRFGLSNQIEYCKLTHLNLAFANPDSNGSILIPPIGSVLADALSNNPDIIIMVSLAGGVLTPQQASNWSNLIDNPANRPSFIANIVNYVLAHNLDGVDVDLEWNHVTIGYSDFVIELKAALASHGKAMTAAFPNATLFSNISPAALAAFDFINIMAYDATGPWAPSSPGQHSSFSFAQDGINFWKNNVGIDSNRLNLGLPFYGYEFVNSSTVNGVSYGQMVSTNTSYADLDRVGNTYYNGRPTIQSKVILANNECGGIFIWELGQDAFNAYSLLTAVHNQYTALGVRTSALCGNEIVLSNTSPETIEATVVFPNPSSHYLRLSNLKNAEVYKIYSASGQLVAEGTVVDENRIDIQSLFQGLYLLRLENGVCLRFLKI